MATGQRLFDRVGGHYRQALRESLPLGPDGRLAKNQCMQSESFMVVGYEQSASARDGIGSLLLAARRGHDWVYVGAVGTERMRPISRKRSTC
jgi:hypothetical protein